jgi:hypothetical protein
LPFSHSSSTPLTPANKLTTWMKPKPKRKSQPTLISLHTSNSAPPSVSALDVFGSLAKFFFFVRVRVNFKL